MGLELKFLPSVGGAKLHPSVLKYGFQYRNACSVCPLKSELGRMEPVGAKRPTIYMLGEAPGREEIKEKAPFVGVSGQLLRLHIPDDVDQSTLRWNNCVRSRPPGNRTPTPVELACCRKSVEDDIEQSKPRAIFGFGNIPLEWAINKTGITQWTGRYMPIKVGAHTCWYLPITHPSYVNRSLEKAYGQKAGDKFRSEIEFAFAMHLKQAFRLVEELGDPVVHGRIEVMQDVKYDLACNNRSVDRIITFIKSMYDEEVVGMDYETNALRPFNSRSKILSVALSGSKETLAWPIKHKKATWSERDLSRIEAAFEDFVVDSECIKAVHSLAFEQEWTAVFYGKRAIRTKRWACTMSQAFILDERQNTNRAGPGPLSLTWLTQQYFGVDIKALNPVNRKDLDNAPLTEVLPYNGVDAKYHRAVYLKQAKRLKSEGLLGTYKEHMRRVPTMVLTQIKGIPINQAVRERLEEKYTRQRKEVERKIAKLSVAKEFFDRKGIELRPSANHDVMFVVDKLLPEEVTEKARDKDEKILNVNEGTLENIKHEFARLILDYRKQAKVLSTYITPMAVGSDVIYEDGLAHPVTQTTRTRTWRTSSDGFNYQNWPKRDDERKEVRGMVKRKGYKVVSVDYAGIQARNVAMESKDAALVKAFRERYDIHADWTERLVGIHARWVDEGAKALAHDKKLFKAYRNRVKNEFVFPSFFGARPETVSHYLGVEESVGKRLQAKFWEMFPDVHKWHDKLFKFYRKHGYVTGLSGFRRRAPISHNEMINSPIQGDESTIVCDAMNRLSEMRKPEFQANMEIHDDLTFIWPEADVNKNLTVVVDTMVNCPFEWAKIVPIGVEASMGDDWHNQKSIGEYFTDTWKGSL